MCIFALYTIYTKVYILFSKKSRDLKVKKDRENINILLTICIMLKKRACACVCQKKVVNLQPH